MSQRPDELTRLLGEAVSDVHPPDRLTAIRKRTRAARSRRRRWCAGGGALVAAAAAVTAVAVVGQLGDQRVVDPAGPAASDSTATVPAPTAGVGQSSAVQAAYELGSTPSGVRLFREFREVQGQPAQMIQTLLGEDPLDPDYRTAFGDGEIDAVAIGSGEVTFTLTVPPSSLSNRAVDQAAYTAWGVLGRRVPVTLTAPDAASDPGIDSSLSITVQPDRDDLDALALVSISDPGEGTVVSGSFTARGRASSFEGSVPWKILDSTGTVVKRYSAQARGGDGLRLYPWHTRIDVSDLAPGTYTFVASTDDPTGGTEGPGPTSDTRTIVVE
ncbi:Gmad2 immunoglobulin-like domain-containing protein [Nocardioides acrostichi]|uniref:Gmad2 immunoglobulin-like domain-containing protein n=1 Tax=Nocardioides acrostichi TaxID=2784339 RepID=A0A930Y8R5_9ACTN|nr:Gmad2 immunoglobulin-like domain-containing protein [Nocardioides acrostichi]MBF4163387.1 Gmad2 immunoglobulin-like domain-containing protein [Nocardioides acrostichi]